MAVEVNVSWAVEFRAFALRKKKNVRQSVRFIITLSNSRGERAASRTDLHIRVECYFVECSAVVSTIVPSVNTPRPHNITHDKRRRVDQTFVPVSVKQYLRVIHGTRVTLYYFRSSEFDIVRRGPSGSIDNNNISPFSTEHAENRRPRGYLVR